jgi:hypothetical protein
MKKKRGNKLGLSFIPYNDVKGLDSEQRVKKILDIILDNRIVILQGKLEPLEETSLIQSTMALIGRIKGFKGVELAAIESEKELGGFEKFKEKVVHALLGQRDSITVIGPAAFVRDIKKDPSKIDLFFKK